MTKEDQDACSAILIVLGRNLNPDVVTERLGLTPKQVWRKGEKKSYEKADGSILYFDSIHEEGGWKKWLEDSDIDKDLMEQIRIWCELLSSKMQVLKELKSLDYELILDCFVATSDCCCSIEIENDTLKKLADFGLDLEITFSGDSK
jgi:hypothetical protein